MRELSGALPTDGPYFDDLEVGLKIASAPSATLTSGLAAAHQAIVGDRLALALDANLSDTVIAPDAVLAHPALVWDLAIGQSTLITQRVVANLFYRGLAFHRAPLIGQTLQTTTEVVALRQNRAKPGRAPTGMAVLRMRTLDQDNRTVLDFWRCAMLPLSEDAGETGHADSFDEIRTELGPAVLGRAIEGWNLEAFRSTVPGPGCAELEPGRSWILQGGDVVSSAPELARLTLNLATVHHDATVTGRRLVYGGHTIGIACSHLARAIPNLVTIVGWYGCDHTGPVFEGDTLKSRVELERVRCLAGGGGLLDLRLTVHAVRADGGDPVPVLDWRPVGVVA
jgi:acyl dehydratase